jgi:ATP adenylyltransferase
VDALWAPWRLSYVSTSKPKETTDECFVCRGVAASNDRENLLVLRTTLSVVILNRFPYNAGHLLICPKAHKARLEELSTEETLDLQQLIQRMIAILEQRMSPHGFNVGLNLGRAAGAGLPGHLHWHIVPRWDGDTNFMPVLTDTKVIVSSLDALYDQLIDELAPTDRPAQT